MHESVLNDENDGDNDSDDDDDYVCSCVCVRVRSQRARMVHLQLGEVDLPTHHRNGIADDLLHLLNAVSWSTVIQTSPRLPSQRRRRLANLNLFKPLCDIGKRDVDEWGWVMHNEFVFSPPRAS